jgi:hypothetical protein
MKVPSFNVKGKQLIRGTFSQREMYAHYIADKTEDSPYYVSFKTYRALLFEYNKHIYTDILTKGYTYRMPSLFGFLYLRKQHCNPKFKPIDWVNTKKLGKYIYLENQHSNEYIYKMMYKLHKSSSHILKAFAFRLARANSRSMAKEIKLGNIDTINILNEK